MSEDIVNRLRAAAYVMFKDGWQSSTLAGAAAEELEAADKAEAIMRDHIKSLEAALKQCQSVLAMFIDPDTIMETTVLNAYALATAAEAKARALLSPAATTAPKPFTFADPAAQREHERIRAESRKGREE